MIGGLRRRQFLAASVAGIAGLAGCQNPDERASGGDTGSSQSPNDETGNDDGNVDNSPVEADEPPLRAVSDDGSSYVEFAPYNGFESYSIRNHSNTYPFDAEVSNGTVTVRIEEATVLREMSIRADFRRADGDIDSGETITINEGGYQEAKEWEVPIDDGALPRNQLSNIAIVIDEASDQYVSNPQLIYEHSYVAIPYENGDESGTHWVNADAINQQHGAEYGISRMNQFHTETIESENYRTRFFVVAHERRNGPVIGAYSAIPRDRHEAYKNYINNWDGEEDRFGWWPREWHPATFVYNADDLEHLATLAESISKSLDEQKVLDRYDRLQQIAYLVGHLDYNESSVHGADPPQVDTLWTASADCTEATMLFSAITHTSSFGHTRGGPFHCALNGESHAIVAIDERDVGDIPSNIDPATHTTTEESKDYGIPDSRYILTELTEPRHIGSIEEGATEPYNLLDTNNLDGTPELREMP